MLFRSVINPGPPPADGPHDDPAVFTAELEALAAFLRGQGVDAVADPAGATLRLTGADEPVTVALRGDLYRRWFEATEEELEAIGGDPRGHAWQLWCRTVASLPGRSPGTRVTLVETPDGEVILRPDDPTAPGYAWSAEPGT